MEKRRLSRRRMLFCEDVPVHEIPRETKREVSGNITMVIAVGHDDIPEACTNVLYREGWLWVDRSG